MTAEQEQAQALIDETSAPPVNPVVYVTVTGWDTHVANVLVLEAGGLFMAPDKCCITGVHWLQPGHRLTHPLGWVFHYGDLMRVIPENSSNSHQASGKIATKP